MNGRAESESATGSERLALRLAAIADSKGATEVALLDMRELVSYTDFLAICTARNERQARAIADEVRLRMKREDGLLPRGAELEGAGWIVLDYLDCVLHIFTPEVRRRYGLEGLWHEAPRIDHGLRATGAQPAASA